jgi:hypothetical protein
MGDREQCKLARRFVSDAAGCDNKQTTFCAAVFRGGLIAKNEIHWQRISRSFCQPVNGAGLLGWNPQGHNPESNT